MPTARAEKRVRTSTKLQSRLAVCAFEWRIQAKLGPGGEQELKIINKDEQLVLAVMAFQREVNNGGYTRLLKNPLS